MSDTGRIIEDAEIARKGEIVASGFKKQAYHCFLCAVFAPHSWTQLGLNIAFSGPVLSGVWQATCGNCRVSSYWLAGSDAVEPTLMYPTGGSAPTAHADMPDDIRSDYDEARGIVGRSPRGAAALLRLALQKLMPHLDEKGENLNTDIGSLVKKGLDPDVQKALDALRVIGNNAVHPGQMDLRDDHETAQSLFQILNFIIEQRIERPRKLETIYSGLPQTARDQIEKRDGDP